MKTRWVLGAALLALGGCTAMDRLAGKGVVSQSVSTRDQATRIEVSPNALYDPGSAPGTPLQLGARWTSDAPQSVALVLAYQSKVSSDRPIVPNFDALQISIDGQVSSFPASKPNDISSGLDNPVAHTQYMSSRAEVQIPYALLQRMVTAKDCWLRADRRQLPGREVLRGTSPERKAHRHRVPPGIHGQGRCRPREQWQGAAERGLSA